MTQSHRDTQTAQTVDRSEEPLLVARGVEKSYRKHRHGRDRIEVLRGASLTVRAGEFVAIMGPSGAGKSTLLYCLSGLEGVDAGELRFAGVDLANASRAQRATLRRHLMGFVFQEYNLVDSLTVEQNVQLPLRAAGLRALLKGVIPTLSRVGMLDHRASYPAELSGGEQQRVAVARVLVTQPDMIFADEPTGALDAGNSHIVLDALHHLANSGSAVVTVTHDPAVAATADRVLTLRGGTLATE